MGRPAKDSSINKSRPTFVDVFAGCGGLSLGLSQAGMQGLFAVERDSGAFETFSANMLGEASRYEFDWPAWLPRQAIGIDELLDQYREQLVRLRGTIDLLAGGPPCQGFSSAGRRKADDPRNQLFRSYLELVELVEPKAVLIENVRGFTVDFEGGGKSDPYSAKLVAALSTKYDVHEALLNLSQFGVPQNRVRYFLIAFKKGISSLDPFELLKAGLPEYLRGLGLTAPAASWSAISDLEVSRCGTRPSRDTSGFREIRYKSPLTAYQKLMSTEQPGPGDLRLPNHRPEIEARFAEIIASCHSEGRLNTSISTELRQRFSIKKRALRVLDPDRPAPTITSMPDDLLHYKEPRILTVRENARLQSFPDWFVFKGKYTTGGERRRHEVPRYTQVANAVPPLVGRAIGTVVVQIISTSGMKLQSHERVTEPAKISA